MASHFRPPPEGESRKRSFRETLVAPLLGAAILTAAGNYISPTETSRVHAEAKPLNSTRLRVMTANVNRWKGPQGNNFDSLVAVLNREKPDLTCLQEVYADSGELDQLYAAGYNILFATARRHPLKGRFGNAAVSPYPIKLIDTVRLPDTETDTGRRALIFSISTTRDELVFVNLHLSIDDTESQRQTDYLASRAPDQIDVMCGDFNQDSNEIQESALGAITSTNSFGIHRATFPAVAPSHEIDFILPTCYALDQNASNTVFINSDHLARIEEINLTSCPGHQAAIAVSQ